MTVPWSAAVSWRLERQHLVTGAPTVADVVRRLGAVPAWSGDAAHAVGRRLADPGSATIGAALERGDLIRTYASRGTPHLLAAEDAGAYLQVRAAGRQWERRSWCEHYGLEPEDWPDLRATVREVVADGPVSRDDLVSRVVEHPRFAHLRDGLSHPSHTLMKPFAWQGDLCFGPVRDGAPTYQSPGASPRWTGLPALDEAGHRLVLAYLEGHGPATRENLHYWLVDGLSAGRRRLEGWLAHLVGDRVVEVDVDGAPMLHLREHVDDLRSAGPPPEVTLLPGHDPWVLGPGTADERVVPPARRPGVTRGANLALRGGVVAGTWSTGASGVEVAWSSAEDRPGPGSMEEEVRRTERLLASAAG